MLRKVYENAKYYYSVSKYKLTRDSSLTIQIFNCGKLEFEIIFISNFFFNLRDERQMHQFRKVPSSLSVSFDILVQIFL